MHFLDRAEKRFGHLALPGIIRILVGFKFLAILLMAISGANGYDYGSFLVFDKELIKQGEWWRLITYIFMTRTLSPIWIIFELLVLWIIGNGIERTWGSFRLNLYFFLGILLTTIAAFFFTPPTEEAYFSITRFVFTASLFFLLRLLTPQYRISAFFRVTGKGEVSRLHHRRHHCPLFFGRFVVFQTGYSPHPRKFFTRFLPFFLAQLTPTRKNLIEKSQVRKEKN